MFKNEVTDFIRSYKHLELIKNPHINEDHLTVVLSVCMVAMATLVWKELERVYGAGGSGHAVYVGAQTEAPGSCLLPPTPVHMLTCQGWR